MFLNRAGQGEDVKYVLHLPVVVEDLVFAVAQAALLTVGKAKVGVVLAARGGLDDGDARMAFQGGGDTIRVGHLDLDLDFKGLADLYAADGDQFVQDVAFAGD